MKAALGALVVAVTLSIASGAAAGPVIDDADAIELANALVEATEEHGICYGWDVSIDDQGTPRSDVGSNLGPGVSVHDERCERYIVLTVSLSWTSESSEAEDSATFDVRSNVPGAPRRADLEGIGITSARLLSSDDITVYNATLALPALASEAGLGPALELEQNTETIPNGHRPDGVDSDWLRQYGWVVATFGIFILGGVLWLVYEIVVRPNNLHRWQR